MPSNSVSKKFTITVNSKGLVTVTGDIEHLGGALDQVTKSLGRYNTAQKGTADATDAWSKKAKGVAGIAGSNTKAFSKMAQGMTSSLVPAYATLAANIFAVSAAFRVLKDAADFSRLQQASLEYSQSIGINLGKVSKSLVQITNQSITMQKAMQTASIASAAGFKPETIEKLAQAARNASVALGRDMADSMDRVFSGALKAEPELLDELGIILRLKPATEAYAATLGKAASQLTTFEKQTAVVNEVIRQADEKFGHLGATMKEGNPYAVIYAKTANAIKIALGGLNTVLGPIISALTKFDGVLIGIAAISMPSILGLFGRQAEEVFASFAINALASVDAVRKVQTSIKAAALELEKMRAIAEERNIDLAFRTGSEDDMNAAARGSKDISKQIPLVDKLRISYSKLNLAMSSINLKAKQIKASFNLMALSFVTALSSADSLATQVEVLDARFFDLFSIPVDESSGLIGMRISTLGPIATRAAHGISVLTVAAGKLVGGFIGLLPYIGLVTIAWDLLGASIEKIRSWTGTSVQKVSGILEGMSNSADIASKSIERLDHTVVVSAEQSRNILNTLTADLQSLKRNAKDLDNFKITPWSDSVAETSLDNIVKVVTGMRELTGLMGENISGSVAIELDNIAEAAKNAGESGIVGERMITSLLSAVEKQAEEISKATNKMEALDKVSFSSMSASLSDLALNGKDAANVMNAVAEAQEDLKNGAIATSAAVRGISEAMATVTDTSAIQKQQDLDAKLAKDLEVNASKLAAIKIKEESKYWNIITQQTETWAARRLDLEQQVIDLRAKHAQDTAANAPKATEQAEEMLRLLDEMATSRVKIADISSKSKLIDISDVRSLKDFVSLQDRQISLVETQIQQARGQLTNAENKYAAEQVIADLQEKQVSLLKGSLQAGKGLLDGTRENEQAYARIADSVLPRLRALLLESKGISAEMVENILLGLASVKPKEDKETSPADSYETELDALYRKNIELRLGAEALYQYDLAQKGIFGEQQAFLIALDNENKLIKEQQKAVKDLAKEKEKAAKANKKITDSIEAYLRRTASTPLDGYGGATDDLADMTNTLFELNDALGINNNFIDDNKKAWDKFNESDQYSPEEKLKEFQAYKLRELELIKKGTDAEIKAYQQLGSAIVNMLQGAAAAAEEGSKKQEALQRAAIGVQMVMATVFGVVAVIRAFAEGGWPLGIATIAVVAAQLAVLGVQMSKVGAGSDTPEAQTTQGRGTVLGDDSAVSESLSNSREILEDYAEIGNEHSSRMLIFLENIDNNTKSLGIELGRSEQFSLFSSRPLDSSTAEGGEYLSLGQDDEGYFEGQYETSQFAKTFSNFTAALTSIFTGGLSGMVMEGVGMLGDEGGDVRDYGISLSIPTAAEGGRYALEPQTIGSLIDEGITAYYYARVDQFTKTPFGKMDSFTANIFAEAQGSIGAWIRDIFSDMLGGIVEGSKALGFDDGMLDTLRNYELPKSMQTSLKDLNSEDTVEAINSWFSALGDDIISDVFPFLTPFQQAGEGMYETFVRVIAETENATNKLKQFGIQAVGFADVVNKQNDIGPQIIKQSLIAAEKYKNVAKILSTATGSVEDIVKLKQDLDEVQNLLINTGAGFEALNSEMIAIADGIDNLTSGLQSYYENFFSEQEQFAGAFRVLEDEFRNIGVILPTTKKEFRALVDEAVRLGDRETYTRLIAINAAWLEGLDLYEDYQDAILDSVFVWNTALVEANKGNETLLETASRLHIVAQSALDVYDGSEDSLESLQNAMDDRYDAELALINGIRDAIESINSSVDDSIRSITLENLGDEDKYGFYAAEAERAYALLASGAITSPEEIEKTAKYAISSADAAYALLDEEGKKENERDQISFISAIGVESEARLNALEGIVNKSTFDIATDVVDKVGWSNIQSDVGTIAELMGRVAENTAISNGIMQQVNESLKPIDVEAIISSGLYDGNATGGSIDERYDYAAELILARLMDAAPGIVGVYENPNIQDDLAYGLKNDPEGIAATVAEYINPYLPTTDLAVPGAQVYEDAAASQVEASNTMLDAATIIRDAAAAIQEASEYIPQYSPQEGAVNA